jgi:calcineurin-like phosphoesterase family protein
MAAGVLEEESHAPESEADMSHRVNRRSFLKITGTTLGIGALYSVAPLLGANGEAGDVARTLWKMNGEHLKPFSFVQLSDTHVGFNGPPDPLGTQAFEQAVETINGLRHRPDLVLVTGDLTHDSEKPGEQALRMKRFQEISSRLKVGTVHYIPGEHDAGLDGGALYRDNFGQTYYAFDHRGVHFIGLDNVSRAKPEVGPEQLAWLKKDLSRFPATAPIVVFTHRPLFDLKPEWEWFTSDGDDVMNMLAPYKNVTVLYGHIHRHHEHAVGGARHLAARSLIFAFPDPETTADKKPLPFDKDQPFKNLGLRIVGEPGARGAGPGSPTIDEVELTMREFSGTVGANQFLKEGAY